MKEIVFLHTTSLGIREYGVIKNMLRREEIVADTEFGQVRVKISYFRNKKIRVKPEAEDCKSLADKHQTSIAEIEKAVNKSIQNL